MFVVHLRDWGSFDCRKLCLESALRSVEPSVVGLAGMFARGPRKRLADAAAETLCAPPRMQVGKSVDLTAAPPRR